MATLNSRSAMVHMDRGAEMRVGPFGAYLIEPLFSDVHQIHHMAWRSMIRRGLVVRVRTEGIVRVYRKHDG